MLCVYGLAPSPAARARWRVPRTVDVYKAERAGFSKISGTLLRLLGRLKLLPRTCWGFLVPLVSTSAASQNHEGQLDTAAE